MGFLFLCVCKRGLCKPPRPRPRLPPHKKQEGEGRKGVENRSSLFHGQAIPTPEPQKKKIVWNQATRSKKQNKRSAPHPGSTLIRLSPPPARGVWWEEGEVCGFGMEARFAWEETRVFIGASPRASP